MKTCVVKNRNVKNEGLEKHTFSGDILPNSASFSINLHLIITHR